MGPVTYHAIIGHSPKQEYALGLAAMNDHEDIPVACGRETPLAGNHVFPADWRKSADEGYGVAIPKGGDPSDLSAADLIIDLVQNSEEPITIVAVGPLTNIADAIQMAPAISANIAEIYIMGGAVKVEGNVGNSGAPITLVPLDATKDVPVTRRFYRALDDNRDAPSANLVYDILTANLGFVDSGGFQFWDSLTSAVFTDPSLTTFEEMQLTVVEEEGPESGYTKPDPNGPTIRVATSANRSEFESLLLTILNWEN